ncbi:hypothetical protein B0H13DRAFT_1916682 [Mycena leptocephala]|jgi:hypothetical protein|nr:hypothetical protein B0H13DRAFT_1916682 [Mycena leptocephala]
MGPLSSIESFMLCIHKDLLAHLLSFWDPTDITVFSATSYVAHGLIKHYCELVWDVDTYFQPWFRDGTEKLRNALRQSGAIVSGSQIIQFFDRTKYPGSDMDIFLRIGGVLNMTRWLTAQGYHLDAKTEGYGCLHRALLRTTTRILLPNSVPNRPIRAVYNYHRYVASTTSVYYQKIQLVVVDINPVQHVLFDFHSSV